MTVLSLGPSTDSKNIINRVTVDEWLNITSDKYALFQINIVCNKYQQYKGMTSSNIAANEIANKIVSESSRGNIIYIKLYKNFDRYFQ